VLPPKDRRDWVWGGEFLNGFYFSDTCGAGSWKSSFSERTFFIGTTDLSPVFFQRNHTQVSKTGYKDLYLLQYEIFLGSPSSVIIR